MWKNHRRTVLLTGLVTLLPMLPGALLWTRLPERMPTHWGLDGTVDGWSSRGFAVFGLPLLLLLMHLFCVFVSDRVDGAREQSVKVLRLLLWIIPAVSLLMGTMIYGEALGLSLPTARLGLLFVGLLLILIGNLLPKCRQNRAIGIRIRWTLEDEGNWYATHRFAGRLWVVGGAVLCLAVLLPVTVQPWVLLTVLLLLVGLPCFYSYRYAVRHSA